MGERVFQFFLARLREPSTWRGILLFLTALGVQIKPDLWEAIVALGLALAGGVGMLAPDQPERLQRLQRPSPPDDPADGDAWADLQRLRGGD